MTITIGIGVIGMGWMGEVHSRSYRQVPDRFRDEGIRPRLVVCADELEERARKAKQTFEFEHYTTDWREVCADPEVEIVNIAAPNFLHLGDGACSGRSRQAHFLRETGWPDTGGNRRDCAHRARGRGPLVCRIQLSMGAARTICTPAHPGGKVRCADPLQGPLLHHVR